MQPEAYFDRVVRFLETQGWNISTSQLTQSIAVVTGTRQSDSYYDRMLTLVATDADTELTDEHLQFLLDAAEEHEVDRLLVTSRRGLDAAAEQIATEHDIGYIDPEMIDDAFIDDFTVEEGSYFDKPANEHSLSSFRRQTLSVAALYLLTGAAFAVLLTILEPLAPQSGDLSSLVLSGAILLGGPILAVVAGLEIARSPLAAAVGSGAGYLLLIGALVAATGGLDWLGQTNLVHPSQSWLVVVLGTVPTMVVGAGATKIGAFARTDENG